MKKRILLLVLLSIVFGSFTFAQAKKPTKRTKPTPVAKDTSAVVAKPLVTFIELGSVRCIPCRMMQPVMKAIREKYGDQIEVMFYDVWLPEQRHYAELYRIRVIPTQVFLDANGKELMRHEGFFPEKDINAFLQSKGLKPKSAVKG